MEVSPASVSQGIYKGKPRNTVARSLAGSLPISAQFMARKSLVAYRQTTGRDDRGHGIELDAVAKAQLTLLQYCFERREHLVIASPPGLAKSENVRALATWALGKDPHLRIVICSQNVEKVSKPWVGHLRSHIVKARYRMIFPSVVPDTIQERGILGESKDGKKEFSLSQFNLLGVDHVDPAVAAVAFDTQAANRRVDIGIFDDIETEATARTHDGREKSFSLLDKVWLNGRLVGAQKGMAVILSNCWHEDDLIHKLRGLGYMSIWSYVDEDKSQMIVNIHNAAEDCPIRANPEAVGLTHLGGDEYAAPLPSWNRSYTPEELTRKQAKSSNYESIYEFKPATDKDRMFPSWSARRCVDGDVSESHGLETPLSNGLPVYTDRDQTRYTFAWGVDFSGTKRKGNVMACFSVDSRGIFRPVEWHFFERLTSDVFIDVIDNAVSRGIYPSTIRLENAGVQSSIIEQFTVDGTKRKKGWVHVIESHATGANKMDAEKGLPSIEVAIRENLVEWSEAMKLDPHVGKDWAMAESQIKQTPRMPRPNETPDAPMAMWFAIKGLRERVAHKRPANAPMLYALGKRRHDG